MLLLYVCILFITSNMLPSHETNAQTIYAAISPKSQKSLEKKYIITPAQLIRLRYASNDEGKHTYVSTAGFYVGSSLFVLGAGAVYFSSYYYGLPIIAIAATYTLFKRNKAAEELTQDQLRIQSVLDALKDQNKEMTNDEFTTLCWRMMTLEK